MYDVYCCRTWNRGIFFKEMNFENLGEKMQNWSPNFTLFKKFYKIVPKKYGKKNYF